MLRIVVLVEQLKMRHHLGNFGKAWVCCLFVWRQQCRYLHLLLNLPWQLHHQAARFGQFMSRIGKQKAT